MRNMVRNTKEEVSSLAKELYAECLPSTTSVSSFSLRSYSSWIHVPYLPAFHRPGM